VAQAKSLWQRYYSVEAIDRAAGTSSISTLETRLIF
jgi:hypothetical protein